MAVALAFGVRAQLLLRRLIERPTEGLPKNGPKRRAPAPAQEFVRLVGLPTTQATGIAVRVGFRCLEFGRIQACLSSRHEGSRWFLNFNLLAGLSHHRRLRLV